MSAGASSHSVRVSPYSRSGLSSSRGSRCGRTRSRRRVPGLRVLAGRGRGRAGRCSRAARVRRPCRTRRAVQRCGRRRVARPGPSSGTRTSRGGCGRPRSVRGPAPCASYRLGTRPVRVRRSGVRPVSRSAVPRAERRVRSPGLPGRGWRRRADRLPSWTPGSPRYEVEVPFFGVGADEQVDVAGRAFGEAVGGLDRQHQVERAQPGQRVLAVAGVEVEAGQRGQDRQEPIVRDRGERLGRRLDAQSGGRGDGDALRLFRGERAGSVAALDDRSPEQPGGLRCREQRAGERRARGLAEERDVVGVAAERRDRSRDPAQRGEHVEQTTVGRGARQDRGNRGCPAGSSPSRGRRRRG